MADIVYMVRHAAPPAEARGRFWGRADPGVERESLDGVRGLARLAWHKPDRLVASPLPRAAATAARLCEAFSLPVEFDSELAEADFGLFEGLLFSEIAERFPELAAEWCDRADGFAFPGGESVAGFLARAAGAWRRCVEAPETAVMAVSHGGVIMTWISLFSGLPLERRFLFRPEYAALTAFVRKKDGTGWALRFFNNKA